LGSVQVRPNGNSANGRRGDRSLAPSRFDRAARWTERQVGRPITFALAFLVVVLWAACGPIFGWSDTWQLVINTGTTIVTFLMVFVIQSTQTRDTQALQLKLDELIRVNKAARNSLMNLEESPQAKVEEIKSGFADLACNDGRGERGASRSRRQDSS
jgi:low affinity Fe/Cu permease